MKKSFTRLLSLVMLLGFLSVTVFGQVTETRVLPKDGTPPALAYTKTTDKLMIIYPKAVMANSGSVRISDANGLLVRVLPATDSRISYAMGDTVTIDLSADLKELKEYSVTVDAGAFKTADAAGDPSTAISSWVFTTGDYTAPTLTSVVPVKGAVIGNQTTYTLELTFEDVDAVIKGASGKISLYKEDGNIWDLIDISQASISTTAPYVLTLGGITNSLRPLEDNTNYVVTIGAGVVTDHGKRADGNVNKFAGLTDRTTWTFSTQDFSAPGYASGYPKIGAVTNNSVSALVKTTEAGTTYAVVSTSATAPTATAIRGDANKRSVSVTAGVEYSISFGGLSENTQYYIYIVTDNSDVLGTSVQTVDPTTTETAAPKLATVVYKRGTTTLSASTTVSSTTGVVTTTGAVDQKLDKIVLTFTEDQDAVKIGAGNVIIKKASDNSDYLTIPSTSLTVSSTNHLEVTVPVSMALENNTKYYIIVPNTLILDKYDNKYAGISSTTGWAFTSNDVLAPTFAITPAEGASNVIKNANVVITFNELVQGNGTYVLGDASTTGNSPFEILDGTTPVAFTVTTSTNSGKYTTVTINPVDFGSGSVITLKIKANAIKDYGVPANLIDTEQGISFVVEDYVGPRISNVSSDPNKWTAPTTPGGVLKVAFNEPIYLLGGGDVTNENLYTIFTLKVGTVDGANVPATFSIDAAKKVITVTPVTPWSSEGSYYAAVSTDLQDMYGNTFDGVNRVKTFTINDVISSTVKFTANSTDLNGQAISVGDAISIAFYEGTTTNLEPISSVAYNGTWNAFAGAADLQKVIVFKNGSATGTDVGFTVSGSNPYIITPTSLVGAKTYYLSIGAATKDAAGNVNEAKAVTFTTKFAGEPVLEATVPDTDEKAVSKTAPITLEFNCDVNVVSSAGIIITDGVTPAIISSVTASGHVVTIAHSSLSSNATYTVTIPAGAIENKNDGTDYTGTSWSFSTVDQLFELAATGKFTPDEVSTAAINAKLELLGAELFVKGTGYIDIKNATTDGLVERIDVASSQVVISGSTVSKATITPSANFAYGASYYIEVSAGAFVDKAGNGMAAVVGKTPGAATWTFTVVNSALQIVKVTPNNVEKVANDQSISVEFNRDIEAASGSVGYIEVVTGMADQTQAYPIGSTQVSISGKVLTISHADKVFPADAQIYLYLEAGAVQIKGNTIAFATDPTRYNVAVNKGTSPSYSFFTGDALPPVPSFNPAAYNASSPVYNNVNTDVVVTFNEDIFLASSGLAIENGDLALIFSIYETATPANTVDFVGSIVGRTVTLNPTADLKENMMYTVKVIGGQITDASGNDLTSDVTSSFMTFDATAPVVNSVTLVGGNKSLALTWDVSDPNFKAFYYLVKLKSEGANPTAADVMAGTKKTTATGSVSITNLLASTEYEVFYVAEDTRGNVTTVGKVSASTIDTVKPTLVSTTPEKGSVDVNVDPTNGIVIKLTFSENVVVGTGTITVKDRTTQTVVGTLTQAALSAVTTPTADAKSLNLTIPTSVFAANLSPLTMYVELGAGTVTDGTNAIDGVFGPDMIYFTTEDNKAPTVISGGTSGDVALNSKVKVKFSEEVNPGTGTAVLYGSTTSPVTLDNAHAVQVFTAAEAAFSGQFAEFTPANNLELNMYYELVAGTGFAADKSTNKNPSVSGSITFRGVSDVPPSVTVAPAGGPIAINKSAIQAGMTVTFSEPVYYPIAGYLKSLVLMTQDEVKSHVTFVNGTGAAVAFTITNKSATGFKVVPVTSTDIKDESAYVLTITGFQDDMGQAMTTDVENYMTSDNLAPSITFNPANNKKDVVATSSLTLTFSEQVYAAVVSANDSIFAYIDNSNVESFVYLYEGTPGSFTSPTSNVAFTASISGNTITIVPDEELESGLVYHYGLMRPVFDINTYPLNVGATGSYAKFTVADYVAPEAGDITAANFAPLGDNTPLNAPMWAIFSEDIQVSTGSVVIRREDGTIFQSVSGADLSIDATNAKKLKIKHNNFESMMNYFVELQASVVTDKSGNPNAAESDPVEGWLFSTNDTYDLMVTSTSPMGDNQPRSVILEVGFDNMPVAQGNKYLAVYKSDGTAVYQIAATDMVVSGMKAMTGGLDLDADQAYYARVEPNSFKDESGNSFAGIMDSSWVFSTVNNIAPEVTALMPADNAMTVDPATSFSMTFDRNIALGSGMIAVRYAADGTLFEEVDVTTATVNGKTLTFNLSSDLDFNTAFYVIVPAGAVTNTEVTADPFAGILNTYTWNFTTADGTVVYPELESFTPQDTTSDSHPTFVMTFVDTVMLSTTGGYLTVTEKDSTAATLHIALTADMVDGKVVTVTYDTLDGRLGINRDYIVTVDGGALESADGVAFAGVSGTTWTFTTGGDWALPVINVNDKIAFKVYPNPFSDKITIDNNDKLTRVLVINIAGQRVMDIEYPQHTISTSNLVSGVYLISLVNEEGLVKTERMVKR